MQPYVEIAYSRLVRDNGRIKVYDSNVPKEMFDAMLERAARHKGYCASWVDLHVFHSSNVTLEEYVNINRLACVTKRKLVEERPLAGCPFVERAFTQMTNLPLTAFSCGTLCGVVKMRRLQLRVHARAHLVFEVASVPAGDGAGASVSDCIRRVRVEISDADRHGDADIQRTVENTVQVVLLGQSPKRAMFKSRR